MRDPGSSATGDDLPTITPHYSGGIDTIGTASFRVLGAFDRVATADVRERVRTVVGRALEDFPELAGETVTIARRMEWDDHLGRADMVSRIVYLPPDHPTSFVTAYHELAHLAIQVHAEQDADVPVTSEEFCGLFGVSRMSPALIDEWRIPYFDEPEIEKELWPDVCLQALQYRLENHDYVKQAGRWLTGEDELPSEVTADA